MSDKLQFLADFVTQHRSTFELDTAFWAMYHLAKRQMVVYPREGFRIGLAGFNAEVPDFKCIIVEHGHKIVPRGGDFNYYVSGERDPAILSEARIKASHIPQKLPTNEIVQILTSIVHECIIAYPATLGEPTYKLVLSNRP